MARPWSRPRWLHTQPCGHRDHPADRGRLYPGYLSYTICAADSPAVASRCATSRCSCHPNRHWHRTSDLRRRRSQARRLRNRRERPCSDEGCAPVSRRRPLANSGGAVLHHLVMGLTHLFRHVQRLHDDTYHHQPHRDQHDEDQPAGEAPRE